MKIIKKYWIILVITIILLTVYWYRFHYFNYNVKIPVTANNIILVNSKKIENEILKKIIVSPKHFNTSNKSNVLSYILDNTKKNDILALFQFPDCGSTEWYAILEEKNNTLENDIVKKFNSVYKTKNCYQKGFLSWFFLDKYIIIGFNTNCLINNKTTLAEKYISTLEERNVDSLIGTSVASIYSSQKKYLPICITIQDSIINFSQEKPYKLSPIQSDELGFLHINKSDLQSNDISIPILNTLDYEQLFLNISTLQTVYETYISVELDEDFNEKKITKKLETNKFKFHNYFITNHPKKLLDSLVSKKWINNQKQVEIIPFLKKNNYKESFNKLEFYSDSIESIPHYQSSILYINPNKIITEIPYNELLNHKIGHVFSHLKTIQFEIQGNQIGGVIHANKNIYDLLLE